MRTVRCSLIILVLALGGCAGESEPDPTPRSSKPRVAKPLTSAEVTAYQAEMAQLFEQRDALAPPRASISGTSVEVGGHTNVALVKVDAEGQLVTTCVDSEQDAMQFLTSSAAEGK
jgi:hypothetical protein